MKRRGLVGGAVILILITAYASTRRTGGPEASSSLSRSGAGWSAMRAYLELRGKSTRTLDRVESRDLPESGVVLLSGTPMAGFTRGEQETLRRFIFGGGTVVFGYGGGLFPPREDATIGVTFSTLSSRSTSLNPFTWLRAMERPLAVADAANVPRIVLPQIPRHPQAEPGDEVLLASIADEPLILLRRLGRGSLIVLPVEALSNGYLREPGNGALLEGIAKRFDEARVWAFDEYHHGVVHPISEVGLKSRAAFDLFVIQVIVAYALFAAAMSRRFGPAWPEPRPASGATSAFLMKVAAIHDRLGHHDAVAETLRARAKELFNIDGEPKVPAKSTGGERLLALARHISREQRERHKA